MQARAFRTQFVVVVVVVIVIVIVVVVVVVLFSCTHGTIKSWVD